MLLRTSTLLLRTLREDPADAELASHKLLVRAGYIRRAAPGGFSWLPLGLRVLKKVEAIVREEMDAIGGQEVHFPALLPKEPYEATGRWEEYGPNLFRLQDRRGADFLLAPTHEEMFTLLVKDQCSSYKDLPLTLYQVQTKYRDEARPRAGLLRGREFVMKDSYSFDVDDAGLEKAYQRHREAYVRIFDRLGLEYVIVSAVSGAMGGSASEEFLHPSPQGEDTYVRSAGGYAANVEAVTTVPPAPVSWEGAPPAVVLDTPDTPTIDTLVAVSNQIHPREDRPWEAADTLKNVIVLLRHPDGSTDPLAVGVPGDREVDPKRLEAAVAPATVEPFDEAQFAKHPELVKGYIGPGGLGLRPTGEVGPDGQPVTTGIRYLLDPRIAPGTAWVTGADQPGKHVFGLVAGRDFTGDGTIDAAEVRDGDPAPDGSGPLETARGMEMGHIFQLGRKYAQALGLQVLDENGKLVTVTMGSYGVGVSRAVAAIAEAGHDELGLVWPRAVSPVDVHVVVAGKDAAVVEGGERLAAELVAAGLDVLLDDRPRVSPGVKFKDAELVGVPTIVTVGKRLTEGVVEVRDRATGERTDVPVEDAARHLVALVRG
ncbi:prolyl-tRNA synthetase [Quadrisphaera granulorum]|uniref:Proline--tRNA ligase n=1 Tax=Quadrisphaera granulorum TaxID=317664 RepID=A0A316AF87_9ACTN|nr:proline--tRNA ligase [Quadrisphaera granulorum]PWJ56445.1 prolyl-tRNA synthetase [Quadrisphaera granulorum]SZE95079.1 prolyl-tRNA synthetase [Quadrisphaera granulorum]